MVTQEIHKDWTDIAKTWKIAEDFINEDLIGEIFFYASNHNDDLTESQIKDFVRTMTKDAVDSQPIWKGLLQLKGDVLRQFFIVLFPKLMTFSSNPKLVKLSNKPF